MRDKDKETWLLGVPPVLLMTTKDPTRRVGFIGMPGNARGNEKKRIPEYGYRVFPGTSQEFNWHGYCIKHNPCQVY